MRILFLMLLVALFQVPGCSRPEETLVMDIHAGQRYRAKLEFTTNVLTHWRAPFTGGNAVTFPAGEVFEIVGDPPAGATAAYCKPERYDELHSRFIPKEDRDAAKYDGYSLVIDFGAIREYAELLEE